MFLQELTIKETENITQAIEQSASETSKQVFLNIWQKILPFIEILGGVIVIYIIYRLVAGISNHLLKTRVKRIDKNVQEIQEQVGEVLKILKKSKKK